MQPPVSGKKTGKENSSAADDGEDGGRAEVKLVFDGDEATDGGENDALRDKRDLSCLSLASRRFCAA